MRERLVRVGKHPFEVVDSEGFQARFSNALCAARTVFYRMAGEVYYLGNPYWSYDECLDAVNAEDERIDAEEKRRLGLA